ncbi:hypothetical protein KVT40_000061 [Elsinoe batatas]|uniref:Uncharacterized protein n=1 Tax=Elsinoe batatas TaxID=2601811 RepID=A0A8K0LAN8_9PEZI|nr:hypothetical protein KVT40_000061 [Elsinoe batatas]
MNSLLVALGGLAAFTTATMQTVTGHVEYRSTIGVLGCKVDTNAVAYWPTTGDCDSVCAKVRNPATGIEKTVLTIGTSSASSVYDISWKRYVELKGQPDTPEGNAAAYDGGTPMEVFPVTMDQCEDLIYYEEDGQKKLPFLALSPNFLNECQASSPNSWVAQNGVLLDFVNDCCTIGKDQKCTGPNPVYCADGALAGYSQVKTNLAVMNVKLDGSEQACLG